MADLIARLNDPQGADAGTHNAYRDWLISLAPQFRLIFHELIEEQGAVAYNCSAGQDRTGVATALVLSALGVPREVIYQDDHLSTVARRPENEMPTIDASKHPDDPAVQFFVRVQSDPRRLTPRPLYDADGRPFLAATFDEIDHRWGSVEDYLDEVLGVDTAELAALRAIYLE